MFRRLRTVPGTAAARCIIGLGVVAGLAMTTPAAAHQGRGPGVAYGHGHGNGHGGPRVSINVGVPAYSPHYAPNYAPYYAAPARYFHLRPPVYYARPAYYAPQVIYSPPLVYSAPILYAPQVVYAPRASAPVYIERDDLQTRPQVASAPAQPPEAFWYYCADSRAYYPYVTQCASAWQPVSPQPPSVAR